VVLKIPIAAALFLVWYAVRAEPETEELPDEGEHGFRRWRRTPHPPAAEAERQKKADAEAGAPIAAAEAEAGDTAEVRSDAAGDVAGDVGAAGEPEATAAPATAATDEAGERP